MSPSNKKKQGKSKHTASVAPPPPTSNKDTSNKASQSTSSPTNDIFTSFRTFIETADLPTIKLFLDTAASSSQGANLRPLWDRAFKEGLRVGHQLYVETVQKLNDARNEGYEEGYEYGRQAEKHDWMMDGYDDILDSPVPIYHELGTQTDAPSMIETGMSTDSQAPASVEPNPPATNTIAIQTEDHLPSPPQTELQPALPQSLPKPSARLDWADDASSLPIIPNKPPLPPLPSPPPLPCMPRDLSALRSSAQKPFSSLQRRKKRSPTQASCNREHLIFPHHHFFTHRTSSKPMFSRSQPRHEFNYRKFSANLNWKDDPRLSDLSRALEALGWIRPVQATRTPPR